MLILTGGMLDQSVFAENETVIIPNGAANPNFDTPTMEWFSPSVATIQSGDTVTWVNKDKEVHNITSGKGISRIDFVTTSHVGTYDGLFQSDSFKPDQSWSHTFTKPGIFHYFCSIHPWMNGAIVVNEQIPSSATDASGQQIVKWPVVKKTMDGKYEADLTWEPHVIATNEKITFVYQFYDGTTGRIIESGIPYRLVIVQNGKDLLEMDGHTQIGGAYNFFSFNNSGATIFRFENMGGGNSFVEFSSIVYENPNATHANVPIIQPARNIALGQEFALLFIMPSVGIMIFIAFWLMWGEKFMKRNKIKHQRKSRLPI